MKTYCRLLPVFLFLLSVNTYSSSDVGEKKYKHGDTFSKLVRRLSYNPDDLSAGDSLRQHCRENDLITKCIDSLNELAEKQPKNKSLRYQAALAYVDEVPGHSLFRQGWLSTRSMDHVTSVIEREPDDWVSLYIRGLNGLYWPTSFRKLPRTIDDLNRCISLSDKLPKGLIRPYFGLAYIALGDAYVKNGEIEKGREVYKKGDLIFDSAKIKNRMAMDDEVLNKFVSEIRHTDSRVDTEIAFLVDGGKNKL